LLDGGDDRWNPEEGRSQKPILTGQKPVEMGMEDGRALLPELAKEYRESR
jgi:hypothetical protein